MGEKILVNFIKFGLFFCLLIPLIVPTNLWYPFIFGKTIIFEISIEILLLAYLILLLVNPSFLPQKSLLLYGLAAFIFILILSTIFSVQPSRSFWGTMARMDGLFTLFHFFAFFILASVIFKTKKDWQKLLMFSCFISFLVALDNLILLKFSFSVLEKISQGILNSYFGSSFPLAGYLLFHIFLAVFLLTQKPNWYFKVFLGLFLILGSLALITTRSQACFLGLIIGLLFFVFWVLFKNPKKKVKIAGLIFFLILLISIGFLFVFRDKSLIERNTYLQSLTNPELPEGRILAWQTAWKGILKRPIFGWGLQNYSVPFNLYYNPEFSLEQFQESWWDKPHNMVLDLGVSAGFLGMVSYLALFGLIFVATQKLFRKGKISRAGQAAIYSIFLSYFIQNFFMFDTFPTYLIFFCLLAFVAQMSVLEKESVKVVKPLVERSPSLSAILAIFLICFFLIFGYFSHKNPISAALYTSEAGAYLKGNNYSLARDNFKKALTFPNFSEKEIRIELARLVINPSNVSISGGSDTISISVENISQEQILTDLEFAASELEKSREKYPLDVDDRVLLGNAYFKMAKLGKQGVIEKAEEVLEEALEISPQRQQTYYILAQVKGLKGEEKEMISLLEKVVSLAPEFAFSRWYLGWGYLTVGEIEKGLLEIEKAQEVGYKLDYSKNGLKFVLSLINAYAEVENYQKVAYLYQELIKRYPDNPQYHASLAATYAQLGDKEKAIFYVKEAIRLDPSLEKEAERFLKTLE